MPYANIQDKLEQQARMRAKRKTEFFSDKFCVSCGTTNNLCLHHRNPETKIESWIWLWGDKRREEELDKCDVMCMSCHTALHNKTRTRYSHDHGSMYRYGSGCRCDECKTWRRDYARSLRERKRCTGV